MCVSNPEVEPYSNSTDRRGLWAKAGGRVGGKVLAQLRETLAEMSPETFPSSSEIRSSSLCSEAPVKREPQPTFLLDSPDSEDV